MKIAICGSTCAGKSTLCHALVARLKEQGVRAEYIGNVTRRMPFEPNNLDVSLPAQYYVIFRHMMEEAAAEVRNDLDVIVCDRSPLDYYYYLIESVGQTNLLRQADFHIIESLKSCISCWLLTYDRYYIIDSDQVVYQHDGKRPETTILRDAVNARFKKFFNSTAFNIPHQWISGAVDKRVTHILKDLGI